jgi:hypothetical protein
MKFNSQICTTKEQSERLLALGLKKETADMTLQTTLDVYYTMPFQEAVEYFENRHLPPHPTILPAWSLHRLIEMMPKRIKNLKEYWDMCGHDIAFVITEDLDVNYEEPFEDEPCYNKYFHEGNLYDKIVNSIAWLIQEGYFNKEYLEE